MTHGLALDKGTNMISSRPQSRIVLSKIATLYNNYEVLSPDTQSEIGKKMQDK